MAYKTSSLFFLSASFTKRNTYLYGLQLHIKMKITALNMSNIYKLYKSVRITVIPGGHNLLIFIKVLTDHCLTGSTKNTG